jgi:nitrate/TMAO reductase-like tetraheme cytochrome c subunit
MAATDENRPALYVTLDQIQGSAHASFTCTTCHTGLNATMHAKRDAARDSCAGCHEKEAELFADGAHANNPLGVKLTCVSCHGNHAVMPTGTSRFHVAMTERCSSCHNEMGERFFGGNPFGMQTHLGRPDVATCWDCHRAHLVLHASDPRSPVNRRNILATCRRCHTNAPDNFADISVHVASSPLPDDPRLRAVTLYMLLILVGTFGFFGYHTALQIRHELRKRREHGEHEQIGGVL